MTFFTKLLPQGGWKCLNTRAWKLQEMLEAFQEYRNSASAIRQSAVYHQRSNLMFFGRNSVRFCAMGGGQNHDLAKL